MRHYDLYSLEYQTDFREYYEKLADLPGFVLLESPIESGGRFDILSAYPYKQFIISEDTPDKRAVLHELSQFLIPEASRVDLPFQGGAIGYCSYDLAAHLLGLKTESQPSLKGIPLLDFGIYDWALIADHQLQKLYLFAANRDPSTEGLVREVLQLLGTNNHSGAENSKTFQGVSDFSALSSKAHYQESFRAIQEALHSGRSYQVNMTQAFKAAYTGDTWAIYKKISAQNPVPFAAFMKTKYADILSFSPERFMCYEQGRISSSPIKGTMRRSRIASEDSLLKSKLASCPKNRAENLMIVDLMRNDLGKIAKAGSVQVSDLCAIQSFNGVHHLVSTVEAECMESLSPFEVFMSCFPGGSITGAPKLESMRIINELEPYARGIYCGSIGYFSMHGRFDTNIAIRTSTAKNGILHLAAGGGIVIDSECEDEYRECYTKIAAILESLR